MKATANKAIIYDDTCPLCVWYTSAFVKTGMLEKHNRISFNELTNKSDIAANMDIHRSKHEIPLVDLKGGETLYGLDSLEFILSQKMPFIAWLLQFRLIRAFFKTFYNIVSYNRRVIVGAAKTQTQTQTQTHSYDCTPDFHVGYRLIYIFLAVLVSILGVYWFANGMAEAFAVPSLAYFNFATLMIAVIAWGIYFCMAFLSIPNNRTRIEYFGQLATTMLMGLGIYIVSMGIVAWIPNEVIAIGGATFAIVASFGVMCQAHFRRLKVVNLANWRMIAWILSFLVAALVVLSSLLSI
ncbi:MAG: DCC1-like thiol-disulfide oxidoreductase family protein [Chitinophagales bacterium]